MYTVGLDEIIFISFYIVNSTNFYRTNESRLFSTFGFKVFYNNGNNNTEFEIPKLYSEYDIEQVIFGSLLGDGKLEKSIRSINARFGFTQSEKHFDYFLHI